MKALTFMLCAAALAACDSPEDRWSGLFWEGEAEPLEHRPGSGATTSTSVSTGAVSTSSSSSGAGGSGGEGGQGEAGGSDGPECEVDMDCNLVNGLPVYTCIPRICSAWRCHDQESLQSGDRCPDGRWCDQPSNTCRGAAACAVTGTSDDNGVYGAQNGEVQWISFDSYGEQVTSTGTDAPRPCTPGTVCSVQTNWTHRFRLLEGVCQL